MYFERLREEKEREGHRERERGTDTERGEGGENQMERDLKVWGKKMCLI